MVEKAIIEIPKGSSCKYETDKETGRIILDRVLKTSHSYPFNYGYIPETLAEDDDELDILTLCDHSIYPGVLVKARIIGGLEIKDNSIPDHKIISVVDQDWNYEFYESIEDISAHMKNIMVNFFKEYKTLENKSVDVGDYYGAKKAIAIIEESRKRRQDYIIKHSKPARKIRPV